MTEDLESIHDIINERMDLINGLKKTEKKCIPTSYIKMFFLGIKDLHLKK